MSVTTRRFRLNHDSATGKVIDDEAILINVVTGRYYSLSDAGCVAWVHLIGGSTIEETAAAITARFDAEPAAVSDDVALLAQELLAQELLADAGPSELVGPVDDQSLSAPGSERAAYPGLELLTFTDMEDLLSFDPPLPGVPAQIAQTLDW